MTLPLTKFCFIFKLIACYLYACSVTDQRRYNCCKICSDHEGLFFTTFLCHLQSITEQTTGNMEFICYFDGT